MLSTLDYFVNSSYLLMNSFIVDSSNKEIDTRRWMSQLDNNLKNLPVINLAIPGKMVPCLDNFELYKSL